MVYRADPVSQVDGSRLQYENCRMASAATGLDFHTLGKKKSNGATMRHYSGDNAGGTGADDAARAWKSGYAETLDIRNGHTFDDAIRDLKAGHLIHLDVWHAASGGPCMSGSGRYGHSTVVAPERSGADWLVADPMCSPGKWQWWPESRLRYGAENWAERVRRGTGGDIPHITLDPDIQARLDRFARELMTRFFPGNEDPNTEDDIGETGGGGSIRYTMTRAHTVSAPSGGGALDVAISAASGLKSSYRAHANAGLDFYADANRTQRLGELSKAAELIYIGNPMGEKAKTASKAVVVGTGAPYADKEPRPTIVYVDDQYLGDPYLVD